MYHSEQKGENLYINKGGKKIKKSLYYKNWYIT